MRKQIAPYLTLITLCAFATPFLATPRMFPASASIHGTTVSKQQLPPSLPPKHSQMVPQGDLGGLWRTDGGFRSNLVIKNDLQTAPLAAVPVLFMADGTEYDLPSIQLEPSGVSLLDINNALQNAPDSIRSHVSQYGSAGLRYQWYWPGVILGSIRVSDEVMSLEYLTHLMANSNTVQSSATTLTPHLIKGMWWKQIPTETGYFCMTNTSGSPISAMFNVLDSNGTERPSQNVIIGPHATEWIELSSSWAQLAASETAGAIEVSYTGPAEALVVHGGLEERTKGYSNEIRFFEIPSHHDKAMSGSDTSAQSTVTYDSTGIMIGSQDPDMQFPLGTRFTPYAVIQNTSASPIAIRLEANYGSASGRSDVQLGSVTLGPLAVRQLDLTAMLAQVGLNRLNGYLNLRSSFQGHISDILIETGSVDNSMSYVFKVPPSLEGPTHSRNLTYWGTAGDMDTMVTFWNYTSEDEDVLFTLFYQKGQHKIPIHLAAHQSIVMTLASLIRSGSPDADGNSIPTNVVEGSARLSGLHGNKDKINIAVQVGVFNVRTATCCCPPWTCDGVESVSTDPSSAQTIIAGDTINFFLSITYEDGSGEPVDATWDSSDPSVADFSDYTLTGESGGSTNVTGTSVDQFSFNTDTWYLVDNEFNRENFCGGDDQNAVGNAVSVTVLAPTYIVKTSLTNPTLCSGNSCGASINYQLYDQNHHPYMKENTGVVEEITITTNTCGGTVNDNSVWFTDASGNLTQPDQVFFCCASATNCHVTWSQKFFSLNKQLTIDFGGGSTGSHNVVTNNCDANGHVSTCPSIVPTP
jgi:hypothetical protein